MKRSKKLLSLVLAALMVVCLLPFGAFATDEANPNPDAYDDEGVHLEKSYDPETGCITIEAYTKGEIIKTEETVKNPDDIVLVLDVSYSMGEDVYTKSWKSEDGKFSYYNCSDGGYYYKDGDNYYQVHGIVNSDGIFYYNRTWLYFEKDGIRYYLKGTEVIQAKNRDNPTYGGNSGTKPEDVDGNPIEPVVNDALSTSSTVYTGILWYEDETSETRLSALKKAAKAFVDNTLANGSDSKIAVVSFSDTASVRCDLTPVDAEHVNTIKAAIDSLTLKDNTYPREGLEKAAGIFAGGNARKDADKTIVMFTDGAPAAADASWTSSLANAAVQEAYGLKSAGVTIYAVGMFNDPEEPVRRYMNAVSSNTPNAKEYRDGGTGIGGYFKMAVSVGELNAIFEGISQEIIEGGSYVEITDKSKILDYMSEYFAVDGDEDDIKTFTAPCIGKNPDGSLKFGDRKPVSVDVTVTGDLVTVTGFDYSAHWCGYDESKEAYRGDKLIVIIPVKMIAAAYTPVEIIPTNGDDSGLYDDDGEPIGPLPDPTIIPDYFVVKHDGSGKDDEYFTVPQDPDDLFDLTDLVPGDPDGEGPGSGYIYGGYSENGEDGTVPGIGVKPEAGDVFVIKEFSAEYFLQPKYFATVNRNGNGQWYHLYLVTGVPADIFTNVGFDLVDDQGKPSLILSKNVYAEFEVADCDEATGTYLPESVAKYSITDVFGAEDGLLYVTQVDQKIVQEKVGDSFVHYGNSFDYTPFWVTKDGVKVTSNTERDVDMTNETRKAGGPAYENIGVAITYSKFTAPSGSVRPVSVQALYSMLDAVADQEVSEHMITKIDNGITTQQCVYSGSNAGTIDYNGSVDTYFAGWFVDEECTVAADFSNISADMTVYAKYIDKSEVSVSGIKSGSGINATVSFAQDVPVSVGFEYSYNGNNGTVKCNNKTVYRPNQLASLAGKSVAYQFSGIMTGSKPVTGKTVVITPYWVTQDGTTVYGSAKTFVCFLNTLVEK